MGIGILTKNLSGCKASLMRALWMPVKYLARLSGFSLKDIHRVIPTRNRDKTVDIVDNYLLSKFSPIFTTSPAPMVINKSPLVQFSNRYFSIAPKEGK